MVAYRRITPNEAFIQSLVEIQDRVGSLETRPAGNIVVREQLTTTDPATGVSTVLGQLPDGSVGLQQWVGDITPPDQPSAPVVAAVDSMLAVSWDGLDINGQVPPADYYKTLIEMSTDGSTGWSKVDELYGKSKAYVYGQPAGATRYFRLVSLDQNENRSVPSAVISGAAKKLVEDDSISSKLASMDSDITTLKSASGGTSIVHSDVTPTPPANGWKDGDVWYQHATSSITSPVKKWYIWRSGAWQQQVLDETFLPLVNIGTGTYGFLKGAQIEANAITVDKLAITSTDNLIAEANFSNSGKLWDLGANNTINISSGRGGTPAMRFTGTTAPTLSKNLSNKVTVGAEDRFRASVYLKSSSTAASGMVKVLGRCYTTTTQYTDIVLATSPAVSGGVWVNAFGISPILPAGTLSMEFLLSVSNPVSSNIIDIDYVAVTRAFDGNLIVDGAIDGKTITGATIQTAANGARIVLDQTSLNAWNTAGDNYFNMSSDTGVNISSIGQAGFDISRKNYCTNPSFEVDTLGWTMASGSMSRDTTKAYSGTASLKANTSSTGNCVVSRKQSQPQQGSFMVSAWVYHNAAAAKNMYVTMYYTDTSNTPVTGGTFNGTTVSVPPNTWTRLTVTDGGVGWPNAASNLRMDVTGVSFATTESMWIDAVLWEPYSNNGVSTTYFDGSTVGSGKLTYVWEGTTGSSISDERTARDVKIKTGGNDVMTPGNQYSKKAPGVGFILPTPYLQTAGLFSDGQVVSLIEGASDPQLTRLDVGNQQINSWSYGDTNIQARGRIYVGAQNGSVDLYGNQVTIKGKVMETAHAEYTNGSGGFAVAGGNVSWDIGTLTPDASTGASSSNYSSYFDAGPLSGSLLVKQDGYYSFGAYTLPRSSPGQGMLRCYTSGGRNLQQIQTTGYYWEISLTTPVVWLLATQYVRFQINYGTAATVDARVWAHRHVF